MYNCNSWIAIFRPVHHNGGSGTASFYSIAAVVADPSSLPQLAESLCGGRGVTNSPPLSANQPVANHLKKQLLSNKERTA